MKTLSIIMLVLLCSSSWARKYAPPSSLDYSVDVKPATAEVPEESTAVILEKEMELKAPTQAIAPVEEAALPATRSSDSKVEAAERNLREDQIPVFKEKEKPVEASTQGFLYKTIIAAAIVMLLIFGLAFSSRKFFQKHGVPNKHTNIRVITQHSLGAKKNLAIVSVAGEYILLGVTEHSINLIKTLSLMDDEVPEQTPSKFNSALKDAESRPDFIELTGVKPNNEENEGFSIRNLKEVVSEKLRGMKEFS